jgi:hypothetical protein
MSDLERGPLREHLDRLPREVPPARDLWPDVARTLAASRRRARVYRTVALASTLAVAAVVAVFVGIEGRRTPAHLVVSPSVTVSMPAPTPVLAVPPPPLPEEDAYQGAERLLDTDLDQRRASLRPAQAAVLDENLRIVDRAIETTRAEVREHPDDPELRAELDRVWEDKLDLIRQASELYSEM